MLKPAKARRWGRGQGLFSIRNVGLLCLGLRGSSCKLEVLFLCVLRWYPPSFASSQSQMKSELAAAASEFGRLTRFLAEEQAGLGGASREMHEAQLGVQEQQPAPLRAGCPAEPPAAEAQRRSQQGGLRLLQVSNGPFLVHPRALCQLYQVVLTKHLSRAASLLIERNTMI